MSTYVKPHRGVLILVFGILSWVFCIIFGILAWMWGNEDLAAIDAGRMDPEGRSLTEAGRLIGMIHVIVFLVAMGVALLFLVFFGLAGVASS